MRLPKERLERIRNVGPTSLQEIESQLAGYYAEKYSLMQAYLATPESATGNPASPANQPHRVAPPGDHTEQRAIDEWRHIFQPLTGDETLIGALVVPKDLQPHLAEAGFCTVADLAQATGHQLLELSRMASVSLSRLRTALIAHMLASPFDAPPGSETAVAAVTPRRRTLAVLVPPDVAARLAEAPLDRIPVERLALSPAQINELYQATVYTVGQLVDFSCYLPSSDPILMALRAYLSTATPDQVAHDALSLEALRRHQSRKAADISFWLLSLKEREQHILEKRYGLYGPALTLEAIGRQLNLTRERVRQLEKRALHQLRQKQATPINAVAGALTDYIRARGGAVTLDEAADWLGEQYAPTAAIDLVGAMTLLATLTDSPHYLRKSRVFLHSDLPPKLFTTIQKTLTDLLQARLSPTAGEVLWDDFQATAAYPAARSLWSDDIGFGLDLFVRACLRTSDDLVEQEPDVYARRQWENRITDNVVVALRQIGEPAHFTTITEAVNRQLAPDQQTSAHSVHATMLRYEDVFARVGHGMYALVEWGLKQEDSIAETAARILRDAGHPLHIETITDEALKSWQVNRSTVFMALHHDGYYRDGSGHSGLCLLLGDGVFSLSEWEAARAAEPRPVLPYCPPILPDPPDFENALFESVVVAHEHLATTPEAGTFLAGMFAWAGYDGEPKRWLQQGVLNSYYLLGLIPYTYILGGGDPRLSSTLRDGTISEIRRGCLVTLTQRLLHMPAFWWLLGHRLPMRQKELAAEFVKVRGDGLDDTEARLTMLAGLGVVIRGADYYFRLTPLGKECATAWGRRPPPGFIAAPTPVEGSSRGGGDDLLDFGVLE